MKKNALLAIPCLIWIGSACAQHAHGTHGSAGSHAHGASSYAGLQSRDIKAMSEREIADIRAGRGMSMALPAELNGYPGPSHVLELAAPLDLSEAQRARTEALFRQMQDEARVAGEALIESEAALERLFSERRASDALVEEATRRAALARGRLRETHLRYHLLMMDVLSPRQVTEYMRLRGYRS
jgi:hypothetical protein